MNMKIALSAAMMVMALGLVACGDSSTGGSSSQAHCQVTKTATTVKVDASYQGQSYVSTATVVSDEKITFHSIYGYPTQAEADRACSSQKEEASHWLDGSYKVSCSGLKVTVDDYSEFLYGAADELAEVEEDFNDMCQTLQNKIDRGEI